VLSGRRTWTRGSPWINRLLSRCCLPAATLCGLSYERTTRILDPSSAARV
jgi:hypothetical protein